MTWTVQGGCAAREKKLSTLHYIICTILTYIADFEETLI